MAALLLAMMPVGVDVSAARTCPSRAPTVELSGGSSLLFEHIGGLRTSDTHNILLHGDALDRSLRVYLGARKIGTASTEEAFPGVDFEMPAFVRIPSGTLPVHRDHNKRYVRFTVRTTGLDYLADNDKATSVFLVEPPEGECPYNIASGSDAPEIFINDTSAPVPGNCTAKVNFSVDRNGFAMREGETVDYRVYIHGPTPLESAFPIIVKWQYLNNRGYKVALANPNPRRVAGKQVHSTEIAFASTLEMLHGRPLKLTITDPDDGIDGDGKVLIAHHVVHNVGSDLRYSSVHCLQSPMALKMTQMLVNVTDVEQVSGQQKSAGTAAEDGKVKAPPETIVEIEEPEEEEEQPQIVVQVDVEPEEEPKKLTPPPEGSEEPPAAVEEAPPEPTPTPTPGPEPTTSCEALRSASNDAANAYRAAYEKALSEGGGYPDPGPMLAAKRAHQACRS